jgi:hypothetical protein
MSRPMSPRNWRTSRATSNRYESTPHRPIDSAMPRTLIIHPGRANVDQSAGSYSRTILKVAWILLSCR